MAGGNLPFGLAPSGSMTSYTPTLREKATDWMRRTLFSDDRAGQGRAEKVMDVASMTPFGFGLDVYDAGREAGQGNLGTAGMLGAMAFVPGPNVKSFKAYKGMHGVTDEGMIVDPTKGRGQHSWDSGKIKNAGFWSSNPDVASHFSNALSRDSMTVFPANVSFNNPLVIDGGGKHAADFQFGANKDVWDSYFSSPEFADYDGVILKNVRDAGGVTDIYVPKDPEQLASPFSGGGR